MQRADVGGSAGGTRQRVLRTVGFGFAAILGIAAVWLIVTSDTVKRTQIGALLGFWAILVAAYPVLGTRHPRVVETGSDVELRPAGPVERIEDAAVRADFERRLQQLVRHEIQSTLAPELATLRAEVTALRSEFLEKVGGQLRMERIETTRVIGSDIEALQHEVRQLKVSREPNDLERFAFTREVFEQTVDDVLSRQRGVAAAVSPAPEQAPGPLIQQAPGPPPAAPPHATEAPVPRFVDVDVDVDVDVEGAEVDSADPGNDAAQFSYTGRRRQHGEGEGSDRAPAGRHAGNAAQWSPADASAGRRRREDDAEDDVLARVLSRERGSDAR